MKWYMLLLIDEVEDDTLIHTERDLRQATLDGHFG